MEFRFETQYDQKGLTVMARALRKTVRKKSSRRSRVFGVGVIVLGTLVTILRQMSGEPWNVQNTLTCGIVLALLLTLLTEDRLNAFFAKKRMLPGTERAVCVFRDEGYTTVTTAAETEFHYESIQRICETSAYFVLLLSRQHGQLFDKASCTGGSLEAFRRMLQEKTGKLIESIQ